MATKNTVKSEKEVTAKAAICTPAAKIAAERGEETYVVVIAKRYSADKARYIKVDANAEALLPTEEEVEVAQNEYFELKNSAALRRSTNRMLEKLVRDTHDRTAAL